MPKPVPIVWNYDYDHVIGHATLRDDGKLELVIIDPELIRMVQKDKEATLKAISVSPTPATRA